MTAERAAKLTALGFAWEGKRRRDDTGWEAHLAKLKMYKRRHGDCNVPQGWAKDPRLGSWVNTQRMYKKKLDHGEPSPGMTTERAAKLAALGFSAPARQATRRNEPEAAPGNAVGRTAAGKCACTPRDSGPPETALTARENIYCAS
jgi:hypothetical protein